MIAKRQRKGEFLNLPGLDSNPTLWPRAGPTQSLFPFLQTELKPGSAHSCANGFAELGWIRPIPAPGPPPRLHPGPSFLLPHSCRAAGVAPWVSEGAGVHGPPGSGVGTPGAGALSAWDLRDLGRGVVSAWDCLEWAGREPGVPDPATIFLLTSGDATFTFSSPETAPLLLPIDWGTSGRS